MVLTNALNDLGDVLNGTCTIQRASETAQDGIGNRPKSFDDLASGVACSPQPDISWSRFYEDAQQRQLSKYDYFIYIATSTDFIPGPKDVITDVVVNEIADGNRYELKAVLDDGGQGHHWLCACDTLKTTSEAA